MDFKKISEVFTSFINSKRFKAFLWHSGAMIAAGAIDLATQELIAWDPNNFITILAGLIFAQITKYLNTKDKEYNQPKKDASIR